MNSINFKNKCCYLLITGASRGIGKAIAIEISKLINSESIVVLLARSETGLLDTKEKILSENKDLRVITKSIDLSKPSNDELNSILAESTINVELSKFEFVVAIHNIGSIGDTSKKASELFDPDDLENYYALNVTSVIRLNNLFLKHFVHQKKVLVNITSACSLTPFKSMSQYSSGKAGREMYFRVLAEEEPNIIVLNYSPGPVDTDMVADVHTNTCDSDIKEYFAKIITTKEILKAPQTSLKLINVLDAGTFKSGDHVDYYD